MSWIHGSPVRCGPFSTLGWPNETDDLNLSTQTQSLRLVLTFSFSGLPE